MNVTSTVTQAIDDAVERVGDVDPRYLAVALGLQILIIVFRSLAWRNVLKAAYPGTRVPVFGLVCSYAAGAAINGFVPARGGEVAKVGLMRTQLPCSKVPTIAASLSVATIFDAVLGATLVVTLWAIGALPALPLPALGVSGPTLAAGTLGAAAAVAGAVFLVLRSARVRRIADDVLCGLSVLRSPRVLLTTVVPFQLAAWACRIAVVMAVLGAYHVQAGLETAVLLVVVAGLSTAVPVPGGAGAQQVLSTYALQGTLSAAGAVSFSLGMQATVAVINTTLGFLAAMLLFRTLRPVAAVRAVRQSAPVRRR